MNLTEAKLTFLDVETTGLSPAMGDRIVEIGIVVCRGPEEHTRLCQLVNPLRAIPATARQVHGIADEDVADCPTFDTIASDVAAAIDDSWIVGHNVRFDIGFVGMELASAGSAARPASCLDTCQLAKAMWTLPNYQLSTVTHKLELHVDRQHRALDDAAAARAVFGRVVDELGGWQAVTVDDVQALHTSLPSWPSDPRGTLPGRLFDALTNGSALRIRYLNGSGQPSSRMIRPVACFPAGRFTYIRAHCEQAGEVRTFRLDRLEVEP